MSSVTKRPEPSPTKTNGTPPHKKPEVALAEVIVPVAENDAIMNDNHKFVVPSRVSFFGGYLVKHIMLDSGCMDMLLPLLGDSDTSTPEEIFNKMSRLFPPASYAWSLVAGFGMSSHTLALVVEHPRGIECRFMIDQELPHQEFVWHVPHVMFHLCNDDIDYLVSNSQRFVLHTRSLTDNLDVYKTAANAPRRTHALLGQAALLERCVSLVFCPLWLVMKSTQYNRDKSSIISLYAEYKALPFAATSALPSDLAHMSLQFNDSDMSVSGDIAPRVFSVG